MFSVNINSLHAFKNEVILTQNTGFNLILSIYEGRKSV